MKSILIADDDEGIRQILTIQLGDAGYRVIEARDGLEAIELFRSERPDIVLTDLRMPYKDGQGLLESVKQEDGNATVVLMSAYATVETAIEVMKSGAFDFLIKPFNEHEVLACVQRALEVSHLKQENRELKQALCDTADHEIDTVSPELRTVYTQARSVADTDATLLILGNTGTGKEFLARDIHKHSHRADGPWIVVNCGALPETLVEAELFGHTKGAFTGATDSRQGRIMAADGGTLFLDEIGDMPLDTQVKFLRFLQEGEVQAVGADSPARVDVRVIAATHRNLPEMIKEGSFREDLFYRLNIISLTLPDLNQRRGDIAQLATTFMSTAARCHGRAAPRLSGEAVKLLESAAWPGNVRQLKNLCERWTLLYPGQELTTQILGVELEGEKPAAGDMAWQLPAQGIDLAELEKSLIEQALELSRGNKSAAARLLGMTRHTLDYRLEKHDIQPK